ncbi:MAG: hypothetical protein HYZ54_06470 [Ignavibacteriae bacterium]|nr:hypothetical protein [Ignavibacteriota bacterium]
MRTTKLLTILFTLFLFKPEFSFAQNTLRSINDSTTTHSSSDSLKGFDNIAWGIGTSLNPLFINNDAYTTPRLYISINQNGIHHFEAGFGYKNKKSLELQPVLLKNSSGRYDTVNVETELQTRVIRFSLGILFNSKFTSNLYNVLGVRFGRTQYISNKQIQGVGSREYNEAQFFLEPLMSFEYLLHEKIGLQCELSYTIHNFFGETLHTPYSGNILVPMSVDPIANRMNLMLNVNWYFLRK